MIEINLAPVPLRKKRKSFLGGSKIPTEVIIGSGGGLLILLVIAHIVLLFINLGRLAEHRTLKKEWEVILPAKNNADQVLGELRDYQAKIKTVKDMTKSENISWAEKMNILSDSLPKGVWLKKITLSDGVLFIEGSAISKEQKEMINVHTLANNLKTNKRFLDQLNDLELGSIQRQHIQTLEIADFLISTKPK
jgi:Tfp pilus assembly protein PilN